MLAAAILQEESAIFVNHNTVLTGYPAIQDSQVIVSRTADACASAQKRVGERFP
jgi:hypothetical protein